MEYFCGPLVRVTVEIRVAREEQNTSRQLGAPIDLAHLVENEV